MVIFATKEIPLKNPPRKSTTSIKKLNDAILRIFFNIYLWNLLRFQETYFNEEEFPRSFTKGAYEGFWWAFVSMTTVGYVK